MDLPKHPGSAGLPLHITSVLACTPASLKAFLGSWVMTGVVSSGSGTLVLPGHAAVAGWTFFLEFAAIKRHVRLFLGDVGCLFCALIACRACLSAGHDTCRKWSEMHRSA